MGDKAHGPRDHEELRRSHRPRLRRLHRNGGRGQGIRRAVGYPVLIKATAGGGGKGMREVHDPADLERSTRRPAKTEAGAAFGNDGVYLEKLVLRPRHVEVQVLADDFGNSIALCERDCSVQRRHQKLLEEAPSPALDEELRRAMGVAAIKAVRATDYQNAGTIEFLFDERGPLLLHGDEHARAGGASGDRDRSPEPTSSKSSCASLRANR